MASTTISQSFIGLEKELNKISEKVLAYQNLYSNLEAIENDLANLREVLIDAPEAKLSEMIKSHREIHIPLSKFGKTIEKVFVNNSDHLLSYFEETSDEINNKEVKNHFSRVVVDYLLRFGDEETARIIIQDMEINEKEIDFYRFQQINDLVSSLEHLIFEPAKIWVQQNALKIGNVANILNYSLAKLELLFQAQSETLEITKVLEKTKKLVPFSQEFSTDFEHVMGSLTYLGRDLSDTPYSDLNLNVKDKLSPVIQMEIDDNIQNSSQKFCHKKLMKFLQNPSDYLCLDKKLLNNPNVLTRFIQTFRIIVSRQAGLSHIDPLYVSFSAGCRVLPKLHSLKLVMASLGKFGSANANTLPIAVELDPIAVRHNIFHCPVIKEVNDNPIRLICGHAISKDAFNSLASGERK